MLQNNTAKDLMSYIGNLSAKQKSCEILLLGNLSRKSEQFKFTYICTPHHKYFKLQLKNGKIIRNFGHVRISLSSKRGFTNATVWLYYTVL